MGGCQSQDARNAAIDANFPADSRHVMMKVTSDKEMIKMEDADSSQQGYKPRAGYQPRAASSGMSAIIEQKRAEQQQSARTMTNSEDEEDTTSAAAPKAERRGTEATALDRSSSSSKI